MHDNKNAHKIIADVTRRDQSKAQPGSHSLNPEPESSSKKGIDTSQEDDQQSIIDKLERELTQWKEKCAELNSTNLANMEIIDKLESKVRDLETANERLLSRFDSLETKFNESRANNGPDTAGEISGDATVIQEDPQIRHTDDLDGARNAIWMKVMERLDAIESKVNSMRETDNTAGGQGDHQCDIPTGRHDTSKFIDKPANEDENTEERDQTKNVENSKRDPIDWAKVTRSGPRLLPAEVRKRVLDCSSALATAGFASAHLSNPNATVNTFTPQPDICAVYFQGIPRGPISTLKKSWKICLPRWEFLSVSFIGSATTEILCHRPLRERLIATLRMLGYRYAPRYDPCRPRTDASGEDLIKPLQQCARR